MSGAAELVPDTGPAPQKGWQHLAPQAGHLLASQVIRRSLRLAVLLLAARMLGVESFGVYALLLTAVEMIAIITGTGYADFLTREVAERPQSAWPLGKRVTQLRFAYAAPGIGFAAAVLAFLRFPSSVILHATLLALTLFPRATSEAAQGILKGLRRFSPLPWIELTQGAVVLVGAAVLMRGGMGIRGVIAAEILGAAAGAFFSARCLAGRLNFRGRDDQTLRTLAASTVTFNAYPLIANLYDRIDVVLLAKLAGSFAVGIYSLPYRVFAMLLIVPYGLMGALLPVFSSDTARRDSLETCSRAMMLLLTTALLIVMATLVFAGPAVLLLLGPSYGESVVVVKILVWAAVPAFLNFALNVLLLSAHRERAFLWTGATCTVFNVAANLLLVPRFSYRAAAWVTVATECLLLGQNMYWSARAMGRLVFPKGGLKIAAAFGVVLAGCWLLQRALPPLWAGSLGCASFTGFALAAMPGLRQFRLPLARRAE